ncbi:SDR family NAD(P)-dependent oxidoreductase [Streptomyces otsuchiensis]|uniref:SDR family NAD(P)-dependent oxidoreductase n=1 Tax=Streptomyces otsuchiensis TaxID=2681388 RepID=UPI001031BFBD|nr:SDR family oxidoreductase [Streptomyces otsuchiensis]
MTRTVVISGGGTGIGLAAAKAFARDGDRTILVGRRPDVLERASAEVEFSEICPADLSEPAGARTVADFVRERFGTVDVLVHSAGGNSSLRPATGPAAADPDSADPDSDDPLDLVARDWSLNFRVNTLSSVLLTEALCDRLASPGGRVLFLSSIAAYRGSGAASYGAAKAALHPYAHDLARRLGHRGVTVNVVAPGIVADTEFFGDTGMPDETWRARVDETLNARAGTPGDIAETLRWLASPAAGHITSQVIQVNGGAQRGN